MLHINKYPVWPSGYRKKSSGFGPLSGTLIEKYDGRYALDPNDLVGGAVWGVPTFLWINDGNGCTIGPPGFTMAATGAPNPNMPTAYQYPGGTDALCEEYPAGAYRDTAVYHIDPNDTQDIVCCVKFHSGYARNAVATRRALCGTQTVGGRGWFFYTTNNGVEPCVRFSLRGDTERLHTGGRYLPSRSPNFAIAVANRDGNTYMWQNGNLGTLPAATPAGSLAGDGVSVGGPVGGTYVSYDGFGVEWWACWVGDGLYETWSADSYRLVLRLSFEALGLRETVSGKLYSPSFSAMVTSRYASWRDGNNRWWMATETTPAAGSSLGFQPRPENTNSITVRTCNPSATTNWTVTGGAIALVSDLAALITAKAEGWGSNVFQVTNTTGSTQYAYTSANAPVVPHALHIIARYSNGAGAKLGWRDVSSGAFTSVVDIADGYAWTYGLNTTPPDVDCRYCIELPDQTILLFIGCAMDAVNPLVPVYPCPTYGTSGETCGPWYGLTEHTPSNTSGSLLTRLTPILWSNTDPGADVLLLSRDTTLGDLLHAESAAPGYARGDGTVQISTGAPAAGVTVDVWSAWRLALQYIQVGILGVPTTGAYDGTIGGTGVMSIGGSAAGGPTPIVATVGIQYVEIRTI